jgi:hypothetical protein
MEVEAVSKILSPKHAGVGIAKRVAVGSGFTVIVTTSVAIQPLEINVHVYVVEDVSPELKIGF